MVTLDCPIIAEYGRQKYFYCIAPAKVLLYIDVMQRVRTNLVYLWSQFSSVGRAIIFVLLAVLFLIFVVFTFTFGFLAATVIIIWAVLSFPAAIAIGYLRFSFNFINYIYFWIAIAAVLGLGFILVAYNVPSSIAASIAVIIVGWSIIFLTLSTYNPPR